MSRNEAKMNSMEWRRSGRLVLRELCLADLPGLQWRAGRERAQTAQLEVWPGAEEAAGLIARAPRAQFAVELDQQVLGALLAGARPSMPEEPVQPWLAVEETGAGAVRSPAELGPVGCFDAALFGSGAMWAAEIGAERASQILMSGRLLLAQQLGCKGTWSLVRPASWSVWRGRLSPEAFVQQVHARAIVDPHLAIYMRAGYLIRGFRRAGDEIEIVMVWARRAH